ncbi:hypothetical protein GCM10011529_14270 [Polymorphobacter glacialis]|uniref:TonB C-terminal domain-containing protein n=1 Tax=Sandarakinorhabdus glacialis TaxID=1614636 RepID=A0A917E6B4_9SPHN|nr:energy transducer TonB [Polymorphobacter glacialis]GGE08998.1 hypothetical protein GCM10011529_14270 [Polymorphobacter glacialis]
MIDEQTSNKLKGAAGALLLQAILGYALFIGLSAGRPMIVPEPVILPISPIAAPPEPTPPPPPKPTAPRPRSTTAAPAPKSIPTIFVAPPPIIPILILPPITAAPIAGDGAAPTAGAAATGEGLGNGEPGPGRGDGDAGDGDGGGGTPPRWLRGRIRDSDYPRAAVMAELQGALVARYHVGTNGRVTACDIIESSGNALLDETTCNLVMERFRYRPALDEAGRPVVSMVYEDHRWVIEKSQ